MSRERKVMEAKDRGFWCGYGLESGGDKSGIKCPYVCSERTRMFWYGVELGIEVRRRLGSDEGLDVLLMELRKEGSVGFVGLDEGVDKGGSIGAASRGVSVRSRRRLVGRSEKK